MKLVLRSMFILLALGICLGAMGKDPAVLQAYRLRSKALRQQIPAVTKAAEAAATQQIAHPEMTIRQSWPNQLAFSDEYIARSGALANWDSYPAQQDKPTPDIFVYAVRSWEEDGQEAKTVLAESKKRGYTVILIGSKQGMPAALPYNFFLDNGAKSGGKDETAINMMANITLGWMWQCEYVSALTRKGQYPGVLMSIALPGADKFDADIAAHKQQLYACNMKIPAGALARAYLDRIDKLIKDVASDHTQGQIAQAADIIAKKMADGGHVGITTAAHCVPFELPHRLKSPFKPFDAEGAPLTAFKDNLKPGDLVVYLGYIGMGSKYGDYGKGIHDAGLLYIASFTPDTDEKNNAPDALARIDQSWKIGDAEVSIPFPPNKMAPISVVNQLLLFRLLDDAVAERMPKK